MSGKQSAVLIMLVILSSVISSVVISKGILGPGKIRASEIELVDHHGRTRAILDATGTLRLMDDEGRDRLLLSGWTGGRLLCMNQPEGTIAELQANQGGRCALEFNDSLGKTAARIGVHQGSPERPRLEVFKNGAPVWTVPEQ